MDNQCSSETSTSDQHPEQRRVLDPKRVLQILECRRKVQKFVEDMLEEDITLDALRKGEELLSRIDYESIVQERYLLKLCGYPLCSNKITREWKQRYHLSLRDKRIFDVEIRKLYCSVKCMDTSIKYCDEYIPVQPIWMRPDDLKMWPDEVVIASDSSEPKAQPDHNEP